LLLKIEDSAKPVIVAVHGTAFGGGNGAGDGRAPIASRCHSVNSANLK